MAKANRSGKVADVTAALESIAPAALAEEWDNVGLLAGDTQAPCRHLLLCIDLTSEVLAEARRAKADMIMAYHPAIFKPLPRITRQAAPIVYDALRAGIAIASIHTAYDVVLGGANDILADALGMSSERRPLQPTRPAAPMKITVFMPPEDLELVSEAAFAAGAGAIGNYSECGFASAAGIGSFRGAAGTHPFVGKPQRREAVQEIAWETLCPPSKLAAVLHAIRSAHSYEEPAIDVVQLAAATESWQDGIGIGRVGDLEKPGTLAQMLQRVRTACGVQGVQLAAAANHRHSTKIRTLAVGCGSCGSRFRDAIAAGADLYVTGELRHHDALAARSAGLAVICVGHSNSERLTLPPLAQRLRRLLPALRVSLSRSDRDPFALA